MTDRELWQKLATADEAKLEQVKRILAGDIITTGQREQSLALLTLTEAAKRMNVSRVTVYRMIRKGILKTVPLNGVSRVRLQSIIDFEEGRAA